MRRPRLRLVLGISIPVLVIVVLLAAWALDSSNASGKVPRNVTLAGRDVSLMAEDTLAATVADIAKQYSTTKVKLRTDDRTYEVEAAKLGLHLDEKATVRGALDIDKGKSKFRQPLVWMSSFLDERRAPLTFTVDDAELEAGLATLGGNADPTEPAIVNTASSFGIVSGSPGRKISSDGVSSQLITRAQSAELPIVVDTRDVEAEPKVSDETARALANRLTENTADGLKITAGEYEATIPAATVRTWVSSQIKDSADGQAGTIVPVLDEKLALKDVTEALPEPTEAKDAQIQLVNGAVQITPSTDGAKCCGEDTAERLLRAIDNGGGSVNLELVEEKAEFSTEDAEKLGIKEPVGGMTEWKGNPQIRSFTTYHDCCAPRVTNIHRIADLIRGTIVKPGEQFSVNAVVGQRTAEKGFVEAGAIANGEHVDEIGGGVSQFATTMFNAAFFAGLPIDTYQAHSEHFSRYPFGREATMGYPNPDLAWTNNTPYGILVWTSYTDTSITVTLYSTQYAYGEQTNQTTGRSGSCTTVNTERTIHYPDGRTATDNFRARYRDAGRTSC